MWKFTHTREREYLTGIPARDLTDDEVADLSEADRERIEVSPLYRHVDDEPTKTAEQAVTDGKGATRGR